MNTCICCCRVGKCTLLTIMQISDQLSVIGFFWWHQYRISVHAKNLYWYTSTASYNVTCISLLVFSTSEGMEKADTITYKHLAHFLSEKWSSPYSVVMGRPRCSLGFSLLHSSVMCIRRSCSRSKHPCVPPAINLAVDEGYLSPLEQCNNILILCCALLFLIKITMSTRTM